MRCEARLDVVRAAGLESRVLPDLVLIGRPDRRAEAQQGGARVVRLAAFAERLGLLLADATEAAVAAVLALQAAAGWDRKALLAATELVAVGQ
jgi:hypothetical protein